MYLHSIQVENYRAIREGSLTLDETTLLIGENDSGRTSLIEALALVLGAPEERFEARLRPIHFHRRQDGGGGPLRVRLGFREDCAGIWRPPAEIASALPEGRNVRRGFEFEFEAGVDRHGWRLAGSGRLPARLENSPALLEWVRRLAPVVWLRSGVVIAPGDRPDAPADPLLQEVARRYWNLITGNTSDMTAELEEGAGAAGRVIGKYTDLFAGMTPIMGAMAAEVLNRRMLSKAGARASAVPAAQKLGMLLLLGAILQMAGRSVLPEGRPVLVLDNPEANLHPMTMASVWRLLERITLQKVIATNSGTLLSNAPLSAIRRLTRHGGAVREWRVRPGVLSPEDLRRVAYHVRSRRGSAMFARCWLLVEGETEFWLMPELARVLGYDFGELGIVPVEFAQSGLHALIKLADTLGISWHLLADGDEAGDHYTAAGRKAGAGAAGVTQLPEADIEHCFWRNGFDDVIRRIAYPGGGLRRPSARAAIHKAIDRASKPFLALSLIEAAAERGPKSVPAPLRRAIEACVERTG